MSSGVAIADDCKNVFEDIKKNKRWVILKTHNRLNNWINFLSFSHRYCVFFIKDEKFITVEKMGGRDASYDDFLTDLQSGGEGECRYGLYDFEYEHQCQVNISHQMLMLCWA